MKTAYIFALFAATLVSAAPSPDTSNGIALRDLTRGECQEKCTNGATEMAEYCDDIKYRAARAICEYVAHRLLEENSQERCVEFCDDWL